MVYTSRIRGNADRRPQAFWGALIPAAINFVGGLITSSQQARAQKRAMEEQQRLAQQQLQVSNQNNLATTLNNYASAQSSYDDTDYNLKYRNGGTRRLGSNGITITDGGNARKIGNNTFLLRGGSHEDINETGQTGIGINVGGNEIEAEGGEVAQKKNKSLRIFSAQPMLSGGLSPAQAIIRGYNKDKVFAAQQRFKKRNHLSDSGGKAKYGTIIPYKRIHINEDGTFTDTLTGKNYNTSATNGEDVVITGKANHWKEAGKKDTSSYFDPMGAVNFAIAAGAPILNANPSNIVGSIRDSKNASDFIKHYMMQNTGGFVNTKWAKKHPYLSLGINTIGDIGLGYGLGKTGVGLYRLRPSNLRKHIFENISPIGYDKSIPRIKEAFKSALSGTEADIDNPSWFNNKSAQNLNIYNAGITKNMFGPHALEARFDAWRKYLGLPQKFNTWTESPIVKGAYTDTKGISNLKVLPKDQSIDFINSAGGNVANNIEEFTTRGYNGQKYGVSHIRDTWDLQPWSRLGGNIIEDKVIRPLYNSTIGKANRKLSISLHKFINKYGYNNEAIQKYLNENGEEALDNLSDIIEYFADTKSIKGKLAHKLSGLDEVLNEKAYYTINKDSKLSKLTNKLSNKIKNFEASSLLPGAKPFKIAYDIPWTNEVFPNNEMIKGFNMINTLPTEAYRYKLKNPLLDYTYRLGGRCKLRNGGKVRKDNYYDWISAISSNLGISPIDGTYDYRTYYNSVTPYERSLMRYAPQGTHFTDVGKRPSHPTFSNESKYSNSKTPGGNWDDNVFIPSMWQFGNNGNKIRNMYMNNTGEGYFNGRRNVFPRSRRKCGGRIKAKDGMSIHLPSSQNRDFLSRITAGHPTARKVVNEIFGDESDRKRFIQDLNIFGLTSDDARRIAKRFGGIEHARRKYLPGGTANPWDKYRVPDYGGTAPWQVSNKYDVNVPYPIGKYDLPITTITAKKDNFNDEMSRRMRDGVQNLKDNSYSKTTVPYLGRQNTFKPATQDYIGLGIDTLAALGSGLFTRSAYNKLNFDYALPNYVDESPVAFDTIYHNEAQRANVERNRLNSRNLIRGNTSSAQTALGRMQQTDTDAMMELNKLADEKANKEVELRNQNAANEQQVRARNAAARNQYYQNVAQIKNAALEAKNNAALAKAQSIGADLSGLSQAWTNFAGSVEQRYNTRQNEAIIAATSKEPAVLSNALQFGYNFSPEVLASIYRNTNDDKLKQLALSRLSPSDRRRYSLFQ